jgi:hypothetical protein
LKLRFLKEDLSMSGESVHEAVLEMLLSGAIQQDDAKKYLKNYRHFEHKRSELCNTYSGKWVAAVNGKILSADTRLNLLKAINTEPDGVRAYFEEVH